MWFFSSAIEVFDVRLISSFILKPQTGNYPVYFVPLDFLGVKQFFPSFGDVFRSFSAVAVIMKLDFV